MNASARLLLDAYPALQDIERSLCADVLQHHVQWLETPSGAVLFDEGSPCRGFPLVIAGEVSVSRGSPQGRALELYRVQRGELCVVSTSCTARTRPMSAHGVTKQTSHIALLASASTSWTPRRCARWPKRRPRRWRIESAQAAGDRGHRRRLSRWPH